jgi:hypothetical protein
MAITERIKGFLGVRIWKVPVFLLITIAIIALAAILIVAVRLSQSSGHLGISISTSKTEYHRSEDIVVFSKVTNPTEYPVVLHFSSTNTIDCVIFDELGQEIYRLSDGMGYAQMIIDWTIPPFSSKTGNLTIYSSQSRLDAGVYTLKFLIVGYPELYDFTPLVIRDP